MSETTDTTSPEAEIQPNRPDLELAPGISPEDMDDLTEKIISALKTVFDPEIPVDVYELGLIYRVAVDESRLVDIDMTLTAPGCPVAGEMPKWVEDAVNAVPGISGVTVKMVFDPPWSHGRMSDVAKVALDMW